MAAIKTREPRKTAKQERSRATLDTILDALDRVALRSGVETFSIVDVAREADIGRATIYDFFPTREALLAAWEERIIERWAARVGAQVLDLLVNPPPFEVSISVLVNMVMEIFSRHARTYRYPPRFESIARGGTRSEVAERVVGMMAEALAQAPDRARLRIARYDIAARIIVNMVLGLASTFALSSWSTEEGALHRAEITTMVCRYLLTDPSDELAAAPPPPRAPSEPPLRAPSEPREESSA